MSWYNSGTVTATLNSATITGVGTTFISSIRVGDGITIAGSTSLHEVTNIVSETQLTISPVYPGTTGSGKSYGIVPVQGYVQGLADQVKSLILSYSSLATDPSITALAAVNGTANTIPYFTSSTTMVPYVASASTIGNSIAVRDGAGVLSSSALEVGVLGAANTPYVDFHSGTTAVDYDTRIISDTPNGTTMGGRMVYYANGGHVMWGTGGLWENSSRVYARNSIVGTVGQSGGVPTGAIIETGTNGNGTYIKYADGTLICYSISQQLVWAANASAVATWTFPVAFISAPRTYGTMQTAAPNFYNGSVYVNSATSATVAGGGTYATSGYVNMLALGRWF